MMDEVMPESPATGTGTRYDDETKERAYQLWAFVLGGNAEKVAARLAESKPPVKVDGRTVRDWVNRYKWPIRRYNDWQQIAPDLIRTLGIDLTFGLLETAAEMRRIVTSTKMLKITTTTPMGSQRTEEVPEIEPKDRIAAGKWIGDNYARLRELGLSAGPPMLDQPTEPLDPSPEAAAERIRLRRESWNQDT